MSGLFSFIAVLSFVILLLSILRFQLIAKVITWSKKTTIIASMVGWLICSMLSGSTAQRPAIQSAFTTQILAPTIAPTTLPVTSSTTIPTKYTPPVSAPSVTATQTPTSIPTPTLTPSELHIGGGQVPLEQITATPSAGQSGNFACDCVKTCSQINSCSEAYYQLEVCGCSIRDGDGDGIPCENVCQQ